MINKLNVIFCGTPKIGADILQALIDMDNVNIKMVITQPDRIVGRKKEVKSSAVKELALKYNLEIVQPEKISLILDQLKKLEFDFLVTCAYGQFIPTSILNLPKIDAINIHGSLLPKYRGGAPIQYAIKNGDNKTGITIMQMVKAMDAGDYYVQEELEILPSDDAGSLFAKMGILGNQMIKKYLFDIANQKFPLIKQDESKVTFSKNISTAEEKIDWNQSEVEIFNFVRSLSPTPVAHTFYNNERYKIGKVRLIDFENEVVTMNMKVHLPGEIVVMDQEGLIVKTGSSYIKILEIQRPGKQMIDAGLYRKNMLTDLKHGRCFE